MSDNNAPSPQQPRVVDVNIAELSDLFSDFASKYDAGMTALKLSLEGYLINGQVSLDNARVA